jgi:hypothetical protein
MTDDCGPTANRGIAALQYTTAPIPTSSPGHLAPRRVSSCASST